jgi:DNA replication and repair protein RecF
VPLQQITCTDFRCLEAADLAADPHYNLVYGANASGKTSVLEAIAYLGRAKSFRGAATQDLVRHGQTEFLLLGKVDAGSRISTVGVRNSRDGLEVRVDGGSNGGAAALASLLPLQVVDPEIHDLVAAGPEQRRRYLDWIAFHVEQGHLDAWRRYRRILKQRNAALRSGASEAQLAAWDKEFCESGEELHLARSRTLEISQPALGETSEALLGNEVCFEYRSGWAPGKTLQRALRDGLERDLQIGSTQVGPHRADLKLVYDDRQARKLVSRGQQKLLACSMVLAATEVVQTQLERPLLLLLDDPAAELDGDSLERLMAAVIDLGCQVIATALQPDTALFPASPRLFHVERGVLRQVP